MNKAYETSPLRPLAERIAAELKGTLTTRALRMKHPDLRGRATAKTIAHHFPEMFERVGVDSIRPKPLSQRARLSSFIGWLVGCGCRLVGWLVAWWLVGWLVHWLVTVGWLVVG